MMQAFRNSAKPVILVLSLSFFAWLVFDLSGLSGGSGLLTQTSVGKINGLAVDSRTYQEAVQQATEVRQRQSPEPLGVADIAQIRDQVWEQFIQQTLMEQEYSRRGIRVTPEELAETIRQVPPPELQGTPEFQTDGQFDMSKYQSWLSSSIGQTYVPALEARYRDELLRQKLFRGLVSNVYVSNGSLWQRYQDEHETARVGLVTVSPAGVTLTPPITVSDAEIDAQYREHRNDFERKRTAFLSYVSMDKAPNGSDTLAARTRSEELRQEILDGAPFAEVAQRESSDTVSGRQGGDLGEWTRGDFDPRFDEAAFNLPINTVSQPVLTNFGFHLIEITKRTGDKVTGRHILVPIELTGTHRDDVDARADSLESLAADRLDRAALDTASRALGLPIQTSGPVLEGSFAAVHPDAVVWAFQAEKNEHSPVIESPTLYFVFRVDSAWAAGVPALALIRSEVERAVRNQKQRAEAKRRAEAVLEGTRSGMALADAATGFEYAEQGPFSRITASVRSGRVRGVAFGLPVGKTSGVIEGDDAFYIVRVLDRTPADSAAFVAELDQLRSQALQAARQAYVRQYILALRDGAKLVDNRSVLFRTTAQADADALVNGPPGGR